MSLTMPPNKTFGGDLEAIQSMIESGEHFAFSRFSDGEVFMMQGQEIIMAADHCKVKGQVHRISYAEDDYKHFDPEQHEVQRQRLVDSFKHRQHNYFKGLSCRCCIGDKDFQWQLDMIKDGYDDIDQENLTWSNLLINSNYLIFLSDVMESMQKRDIIMVVNKNAALHDLGFNIKQDFRVGSNCIVNDYEIIETISEYIRKNNIHDNLCLFDASSLSNMAIHKLYEEFPNNTYMDIGSSLNPFMPGIGSRRRYMNQLHSGKVTYKSCEW